MNAAALDQPAAQPGFAGRWLAAGTLPRGLVFAALGLFALIVLTANFRAPLWLDENFSATIATAPGFAGLLDWCLHELSGPLFYSTLWGWEKLAGDSNVALRLPSVLFALAAPLLILLRGHPDPETRKLWAINLAMWTPFFAIASEARPYTLMLLLGCGQAIAFLNLLRAPTTRRAAIWAGVSALAVLTHYHAAVIAGVQGLAYLLVCRKAALRTWPAALVLLPMAAWMKWHLGFVLHYAGSGQTWYQVLTATEALFVPVFLCGSLAAALALVVLLPGSIHARIVRARAEGALRVSPEAVLVTTGLVAALIVVGMGFMRPSFTSRYLLPYVGAVSLLLPLVLREVTPRLQAAPVLVVLLLMSCAAPTLMDHIDAPEADHRYTFNFEQPSHWIMAQDQGAATRRVVFLWDNPTAQMGDGAKLAEVGGFFFRRAQRPVTVLVPHYALNADPTPSVMALAQGRADTAVIWAFDKAVPNTSAARFVPGVLADKAAWNCRDFGAGSIAVLACLPTPRGGKPAKTGNSSHTP